MNNGKGNNMDYYNILKAELADRAGGMMGEVVKIVSARHLSPEEAIGKPDRTDFPILKLDVQVFF